MAKVLSLRQGASQGLGQEPEETSMRSIDRLAVAQEDVRNWVAKVLIDTLRQGASQGLLQEPEESQPGAVAPPSAALTRLLMTMLVHADEQPRATRTYVYRDSNEQMFRILKVSGPIIADSDRTRNINC